MLNGISHETLVYPKFSENDCGLIRLGGPGLGNLLFPWARAVALAHTYNLKFVAPTWRTVKVGPILRGERDKRWYWRLFKDRPGYVRGVHKLRALTHPRISEEEFLAIAEKTNLGRKLVVCEGLGDLFKPFLSNANRVRQELWAITREKQKPRDLSAMRKAIVLHVRCGDFLPASMNDVEQGNDSRRVPMPWYLQMVKQLRAATHDNMPVLVASDGEDSDLAELLSLSNCRRVHASTAIEQLLGIGSSGVLVASGSTFSMWGSFIGGMPVVWPKGQLRQRLYADHQETEIEVGLGDNLPTSFAAAAKARLIG